MSKSATLTLQQDSVRTFESLNQLLVKLMLRPPARLTVEGPSWQVQLLSGPDVSTYPASIETSMTLSSAIGVARLILHQLER